MRIKQSFWALLGRELPQAPEVIAEHIRKAMLLALKTHCGEQPHLINTRIKVARDIYELWYLRPDLMLILSVSAGEAAARNVVAQITAQFKDHHPLAGHPRINAPSH